jgi:hypothetical protein
MSVVNHERQAQIDCLSPASELERTHSSPINIIENLSRLACAVWDEYLPPENPDYFRAIEMEFMPERRRLMQVAENYFTEQKYFECMLTLKKVRELVVPSFDTSSLIHIDAIIIHLQSMDTAIFDSIPNIDNKESKVQSATPTITENIKEAA